MERNPDSFEIVYFDAYDRYSHTEPLILDTREYAERVWRAVLERHGKKVDLVVTSDTRFGALSNDMVVLHDQIRRDMDKFTACPICQVRVSWTRPNDVRFSEKTEFHMYVKCDGKWFATSSKTNLLGYPIMIKEKFVASLLEKDKDVDIDWVF